MSLLLLACTADKRGGDTASDTRGDAVEDTVVETGEDTGEDPGEDPGEDTATDSATAERGELPILSEAVDLDPDPGVLHVTLNPRPAIVSIGGVEFDGYAYEGQVPGPMLRAAKGTLLRVDVENGLDADTTIHWHGIRAPAAMDGVAWITDPIPPGGSFTYEVPLEDAMTAWYHPHLDVDHQVDLGLYGALVVDDPSEASLPFDVDVALVFDAWGEVSQGDEHGLYSPDDVVWSVNGAVDPIWTLPAGTRARARLLNASNTAYLALDWAGTRQIAGDQGLLAAPLEGPYVLAPGDRVELEVLADAVLVTTAPYTPSGPSWGEPVRVLTVVSEAPPPPADIPWTGEAPAPDPGWTDLTWVFAGGEEGWLINGESWPDVTPSTVALGAETIFEVRNVSPTEHPFHLHGNPFEVLSVDGMAPAAKTVEDTVNVPVQGVLRARMAPDNPGVWALHCHLLGHEEGGMMTLLEVAAPE